MDTASPLAPGLPALLGALLLGLAAPALAQRATVPLRGVNVHNAAGPEIGFVDLMNLNRVRIDVNWSDVERVSGVYDWTGIDQAVEAAASRGLGIYANVGSVPPWACRAGSSGDGCVPAGSERWTAFVDAAARRYLGLVEFWGIGNEPNVRRFWQGDALEYVSLLLQPAALAIHAADPAAKVAAADLSGTLKPSIPFDAFNDAIANSGTAPLIDAVSVHVYEEGSPGWPCPSFPDPTGIYDRLFNGSFCTRSLVYFIDRGPLSGRPILVTEFGFAGGGDAGWRIPWTFTLFAPEERVLGLFFYELLDSPGSNLGLIRQDYTPKAGAWALSSGLPRGDEPARPILADSFDRPWSGSFFRWHFPRGGAVLLGGALGNVVKDFTAKIPDTWARDAEVTSTVTIVDDLGNPWNWAGALVRSRLPADGFRDSGYLAFVRSNGDVGLFRAPDTRIGYVSGTGLDPKTKPVRLTLRALASRLSVLVDGREVISVDDDTWQDGLSGLQNLSLARHDDVLVRRTAGPSGGGAAAPALSVRAVPPG
jgi:hypothetical protein